MKDELINIVALIVRHMAEEGHYALHGRTILDGLMDEGYDPVDIDDALSWFESLAGVGEDMAGVELMAGFKGFRVQSPAEKDSLTPEAFTYLARLNRAGIVDDVLRETLLDKIHELSIPGFGIDQLKALLGLVFYAKGGLITGDVFYMLGERGAGSLTN